MNRKQEERLNNLKYYFRDGDFWPDLWRVWLPVAVVIAIAVLVCVS